METLTLATVQRDAVDINGTKYQLKSADEFTLNYFIKLSGIGEIIQKLDHEKKSDARKIAKYLKKFIADVLIAPRKVQKKLTDQERVTIINFFLEQKKKRDQAANTALSQS